MTNTHSFEAIVTAMFDCVPDPMVRLGPNGILLEQNEEAEAMFGTDWGLFEKHRQAQPCGDGAAPD